VGALLTTVVATATGNLSKVNSYSKTGKLTKQTEQGMEIDYKYDNLGRLTDVTEPGSINNL